MEDKNAGFISPRLLFYIISNGIHHLLAASAKEPMTEEILLQIASSMEPAPHPTYAEVEGGDDRFGAGCKDLGD